MRSRILSPMTEQRIGGADQARKFTGIRDRLYRLQSPDLSVPSIYDTFTPDTAPAGSAFPNSPRRCLIDLIRSRSNGDRSWSDPRIINTLAIGCPDRSPPKWRTRFVVIHAAQIGASHSKGDPERGDPATARAERNTAEHPISEESAADPPRFREINRVAGLKLMWMGTVKTPNTKDKKGDVGPVPDAKRNRWAA